MRLARKHVKSVRPLVLLRLVPQPLVLLRLVPQPFVLLRLVLRLL
jgi:hypothetical protein